MVSHCESFPLCPALGLTGLVAALVPVLVLVLVPAPEPKPEPAPEPAPVPVGVSVVEVTVEGSTEKIFTDLSSTSLDGQIQI